jgi:hypothetical protein
VKLVRVLAAAGAALALVGGGRVQAQGLSGRVAVEAIAAASSQVKSPDDPAVVLDLVGTIRLADGFDLVVRPWSRRHPGGEWVFEMYQLQLRYVSRTRVPFRVDAGIMPSPVGLFTLELQPHRNPLISAPFYYFSPLPPADGGERLRLISGGYPLGAIVSTSGSWWDARAGVTDSSPAMPRHVFSETAPHARPQLVAGGGVTPVMGLRLGVGLARGRYGSNTTLDTGAVGDAPVASVFNVEGEYAFGYTRLTGEWVRNRFDTPRGSAVARGFNVQAVQTLTPRLFAASRVTRVSTPVATVPVPVLRSSTAFEATLGFRLSPELTVRGGYQRERGYQDAAWSNAAVMSLVWAERWW